MLNFLGYDQKVKTQKYDHTTTLNKILLTKSFDLQCDCKITGSIVNL